MNEKKTYILSAGGEIIAVYDTTCTADELFKWAKAKEMNPIEVYEEDPESLQFYCLDGRIWMNEKRDAEVKCIAAEAA